MSRIQVSEITSMRGLINLQNYRYVRAADIWIEAGFAYDRSRCKAERQMNRERKRVTLKWKGRYDRHMIKKIIMKCMLVAGACSIMMGCSNQGDKKFKAEMKGEDASVLYRLEVEGDAVVASESESFFRYKKKEKVFYNYHLTMLESSLDSLNASAGTQTSITADEKELVITVKTSFHFKDVKPEEITYVFGSDYQSLLTESSLPSWNKVKKSLEETGFKVTSM